MSIRQRFNIVFANFFHQEDVKLKEVVSYSSEASEAASFSSDMPAPNPSDSGPWNYLPDDVCRHIATLAYINNSTDLVALLRLVCTSWKRCMDFNLVQLDINGRKFQMPIVSLSTRFPFVTKVCLRDKLFPGLLEEVGNLPALRTLTIRDVMFCGQQTFDSFAALSNIQDLSLNNIRELNEDTFTALLPLTSLTRLMIKNCSGFTNDCLAQLPQLPLLQSIDVSGSHDLSDHGLRLLCNQNPPLTELTIRGWTRVTNEGLAICSALSTLTCLQLGAPLLRG